jgi:hypothetical protein
MLPSKAICKVHEIEDQYPNFNKTGDENKRRDYIIQREKTGNKNSSSGQNHLTTLAASQNYSPN